MGAEQEGVGLVLGLIGLLSFTVFQFGVICLALWVFVAVCRFLFPDDNQEETLTTRDQ